MRKLKEFKLVRRVVSYEVCIIDAYSKEEALQMYLSEESVEGWEYDNMSEGDCSLIAIDERGKNGEFSITHDVDPDSCTFVD